MGALVQAPLVLLQLSAVQTLLSSHDLLEPAWQLELAQLSPLVQALPSEQVPAAAVLVH